MLASVLEEEGHSGSEGPIQEGRWEQEEHDRFLIGKVMFYFRNYAVWKGLEGSGKGCKDQNWITSTFSCSEVLY